MVRSTTTREAQKLKFELHKYQARAFTSTKQYVISCAGIQSGKSLEGALWLLSKAAHTPNPGANFILCAPTYKILAQASLPTFRKIAGAYGEYKAKDGEFHFHHGPTVYVRSMTDGDAIEGITDVEGIWLDEGGRITRYAWENVMGRAAFKGCQVKITTTPYALNWLYQLWQSWTKGHEPDVDFVIFKSIDNPFFPRAEYEKQKIRLGPVRFKMKYDGIFGQMEGLVFPNVRWIDSMELPPGTEYYAGVDWGFTKPFAMSIRALTPEGYHYRVGEFAVTRTGINDLIRICKARQQLYNIKLFICDPAQPAHIADFNNHGLPAVAGNNDITAGIEEHRSLINEDRFAIFKDMNPFGFDEYATYHYPEDAEDKHVDEDEKEQHPVKRNDHSIDADRYVSMYLAPQSVKHRRVANVKQQLNENERRIKRLKEGSGRSEVA